MIAEYSEMLAEGGDTSPSALFFGGRQYALGQSHKHLPEMMKVCSLSSAPAFCPVVVPHFSGMEITVMLFVDDVSGSPDDIRQAYADCYGGEGLVHFTSDASEGGFLSSAAFSGWEITFNFTILIQQGVVILHG